MGSEMTLWIHHSRLGPPTSEGLEVTREKTARVLFKLQDSTHVNSNHVHILAGWFKERPSETSGPDFYFFNEGLAWLTHMGLSNSHVTAPISTSRGYSEAISLVAPVCL